LLSSGLHAFWTGQADVRTEVVDATQARFEHADLKLIAQWPGARNLLNIVLGDKGPGEPGLASKVVNLL
jgi:hypothetical protein